MMHGRVLTVLGGGLLAQTIALAALADLPGGDPEAGRQAAGMCRTCHGMDGFALIPIAPHIGGEPAAYLAAQLAAFRSGEREHEMMTVVTRGLSDQAIADVAAWYASHIPVASLPPGVSEDDAPLECVACHGATGIAEMEDVPHLAGENVMYIDTQLKAFRGGRRSHEIMSMIAEDLTDDEIRDIAEWFAAIEFRIEVPE